MTDQWKPPRPASICVELSEQSIDLLDQLAAHGIYGWNRNVVAGRLIDQGLQALVPRPVLRGRRKAARK